MTLGCVLATARACSFAAGLFEGVELDGKALKEKPEKLAYLDKLQKYTEDVLGETLSVVRIGLAPAGGAIRIEPGNTFCFFGLVCVNCAGQVRESGCWC